MSTGTRPRRRAAVVLAAVLLAAGCGAPAPAARPPQPGPPATATAPASSAFSWFKAGRAPAGWRAVELPGRAAVMAYPPGAAPVPSDPGTVAAGAGGPDGQVLIYLNATPRQGAESLANWKSFRLDHLKGEHASSAALDASVTGLVFRGGTGSCVIDHYMTRIGAHHYREIACLVSGRHGSSVIVAATPASVWFRYRTILEQAVDSYELL